jgi:uncharacterized protein YbjT (DUF2867 family)
MSDVSVPGPTATRIAAPLQTRAAHTEIAVIGGHGRIGSALISRLALRPYLRIVVIGRSERFPTAKLPRNVTFAQVVSRADIGTAIADATHVVNCASIYLNDEILQNPPRNLQRIVAVGSTRSFTALEDKHADAIRAAEEKFQDSGLPGVMLQPSMIYGGGDKNVSRIAYYLTLTPFVPLPNGGRALIQPVHYEDVVAAIEAALFSPKAPGTPIIVAGPRAITIRSLVEKVAQQIGRRIRVVSVPMSSLYLAAAITRMLPWFPSVSKFQIDRMLEDRAFDISEMLDRLGVHPRDFEIDASILNPPR